MNTPSGLRYTSTHEWVRLEGTRATVGITDHAQELLGEIVYIELPELDTEVNAGDAVAVVESVKAASDIYAPLEGKIAAVNESLPDAPDTVNSDAFGDGWLFVVEGVKPEAFAGLMSAEDYVKEVDA